MSDVQHKTRDCGVTCSVVPLHLGVDCFCHLYTPLKSNFTVFLCKYNALYVIMLRYGLNIQI